MLTTEQQQKALNVLLQKKQNALCADCNAKSPCWVSLDFGVFICMNCSGAHRALGPTVTRVRSTKLDTWNREWLDNMKIGNTVLNEYWENQLVGISRASKPNVNSSLKDIIKFVEEKYLKRSFIDPNQPADPLKRWKMGLFDNNPPKQAVQPKAVKEAARSKSIIEPSSDFSVFSQIMPSKVAPKQQPTKKSDNLLSFQLSEDTKKQQSLLGSFAEHPNHSSSVPNKYDHAQFHTISGYNASNPTKQDWVNFDNLVKKNEQTHIHHANKPIPPSNHANHFINPNPTHFQSNAGHYSMGHYNAHQNQAPQYDKAQYITMNINMNMYPKVMNINMSTPPQQQPILAPQSNPQTSAFNNQFLGNHPSSTAKPTSITLQSSINLDTLGVSSLPQKKSEQKSWIDDWK